jgi:SAM-dependent methyltransferase
MTTTARVLNVLRRGKQRVLAAGQSVRRQRAERILAQVAREEFAYQRHIRIERSIEYRFVFEQLMRTTPATILDVGPGTTALPALMASAGHVVTAIDNVKDFWPDGMFNRHFHVIDDDIRTSHLQTTFDLVTCVSVLEHIHDGDAAVAGMFNLLRPGGHLVLTCPYTDHRYCPNVYQLETSDAYGRDVPFICQSYSRGQLDGWLAHNHAEIVHQEFWRLYSGEFWSCGEQVWPPVQVNASDSHQLTCLMLRKA